jgi:hypothetical protein
MLEWVPAGLNTGALSGAKASSSRTRDTDTPMSTDDLVAYKGTATLQERVAY